MGTSLRAKAVIGFLRTSANINPEIVAEKNKNLVKDLRSMELLFKPYAPPRGYRLQKTIVDGLPVELFSKKEGASDMLVFVCHGGAYVTRMAFIYRWLNRSYSLASGGGSVLHFDYRCYPEAVYPAALEDAQKAWDWALKQGFREENIILVGDSAGGNLSLALLLKLRDEGKKLPRAVVCMSPWLDMTASGRSYIENYGVDPLFGKKGETPDEASLEQLKDCEVYAWTGGHDRADPYVSPVYGDVTGFPPMLLTVGGNEMLLDDSKTMYQKMKDAGRECRLHISPGMFHAFNLYRFFPESSRAFRLVTDYITEKSADR